jgi:hypothetical protein
VILKSRDEIHSPLRIDNPSSTAGRSGQINVITDRAAT